VTVELAFDDRGSGLPVVLLHAFPLSSAMWDGVRDTLAERCRVITPDQRGFGRSELGNDEPSLDACADDVAALLDRLDLDRAVLGGSSMGGYVAMAFLRRHADRVQALVLAGTKASGDPQPARENRLAMAGVLERDGSAVLLDAVLPALLGPTTTERRPEVTARVRALVETAPPAAAAWAQRAMAARPDSFDTLRAADVPALVVVGEEDGLAPVGDAEAMADVLPQARLHVLPDAGHLAALETPSAFAQAVGDFVVSL
jgi:pimeloyl-ACP methyl ester carboxylesterase